MSRAFPDKSQILVLNGAQTSTLVVAREAAQEVIDLLSFSLRQNCRRLSLSVRSENTATHQNIFAHCQADTWLLFITDQRKVRVKEIVSSIAFSCCSKSYHVYQHVREAIPGHCSVGPTLDFEV